MVRARVRSETFAPAVVAGTGAILFLVALGHHVREMLVLGELWGPAVALLVDGLPAVGLVWAGYWLSGTELTTENRWLTCRWCLVGAVLFGGAIGLTLFVRAFEGRAITEPVFPLLVSLNAGAIAGFLGGYEQARARSKTRRAETVTEAFAFVNDLVRHDLRNDLTVIRGCADQLGDGVDGEADRDAVAIIREKADEATDRIETSGAVAETLLEEPDFESVDIAPLTTEIATRVERAHGVTVTTDLPDRAPVRANSGVRSVVDNVLENAAEHNDTDDPRIHIEGEMTERTVRLTVTDNGPGIPPEERTQLFDAREDDDRGGLLLVGRLVEEYGGEVSVEAGEPHGSVFTVELPRG